MIALDHLRAELEQIRSDGIFKGERILTSRQGVAVRVDGDREVLNFCANNYLGLADHPKVIEAARAALERYGFGMASVRFICGTQDLHRQLESAIAAFFGTDDAILYSSCFDANGGLFETLLAAQDAVVSDALNHASIIDGIRLCKASRFRFAHSDMADLEAKLEEAKEARTRLVATDGVFSMDGDIARLDELVAIAKKKGALVMVDDSHATGFVGKTGRGSAEEHDVLGDVDVFTSTLGKALGGGSGGFTTGRQEIIDLLRQRSRPYLFSNSLPPPLAAAGIEVFKLLSSTTELRDRLEENTRLFREALSGAGFSIKPGTHPIVPIMLHDARLARDVADDLLVEGIYVIGFSYPVVPKDEARIRVQLSAAHTTEHIERCVGAFTTVGRKHGVL